MSDYVIPKDLVQQATQIARTKSELPVRDMLIRGILAGAFLGYATALVFTVLSGTSAHRRRDRFSCGLRDTRIAGSRTRYRKFRTAPGGPDGRNAEFS